MLRPEQLLDELEMIARDVRSARRSPAMPKEAFANALKMDVRTFEDFAADWGLTKLSRQRWTVDFALMDSGDVERIEAEWKKRPRRKK